MGSRLARSLTAACLALISFVAIYGCSGEKPLDASESMEGQLKDAKIKTEGVTSKDGIVKAEGKTPPGEPAAK